MSAATMVDNYTPVGDLIGIVLCWVMFILVYCSYVSRNRSFKLFLGILISLMVASYSSILYRTVLETWTPEKTVPISLFRLIMHASMYTVLSLFILYIAEVTRLSAKEKRFSLTVAGVLLAACVLCDLLGTLFGFGFRIDAEGRAQQGFSVFSVGYLLFVGANFMMLMYVRKKIYHRVMIGFFLTVIIAVGLNLMQRLNGQSSFTVVSFAFPVMAMLYFMHSNPYDATLGAVNREAMDDYIRHAVQTGEPFGYMSLYMPHFDQDGSVLPEPLKAAMRQVLMASFHRAVLFFAGRGHYLLIYPARRNPDAEQRIQRLMREFEQYHARFQYDYKIVIGQSADPPIYIDYASFLRNMHHSMDTNSVHTVKSSERNSYDRYAYILGELSSIYNTRDLNDPRVLVYCQPVYDLAQKRYDTGESLMRLNLEKTGIIFPNEFIHIAEENGYIHVLTEIILHKTCEEIRRLDQEGYRFHRISVNITADELKDPGFSTDILRIIDHSGISCDRIALELTESENESDFRIAQEKINQLREHGIKFYLDDFGTGYSSMERIMQLPFDIIKFDRSLVLASAADTKSATIVRNLAQLFAAMNYSVLYEGVETEKDELRCREMSASYLQGYKYSKPVPIAEMKRFFEHES